MSSDGGRDRWQEICRHFDEAVARHGAARLSYLEGIPQEFRTEVAELLDSYAGAAEVLAPPTEILGLESPAAEPTLGRVGNYELLELLGRGGMGAVYLARRADDVYQKIVAIKILQRGLESSEGLARFRAERQILAGLEHPNIARLFDGGNTDDGRPFLVMERIEGIAIDRYADLKRLTVAERLDLFCKVAGAVQFAHQSLVIHRDLKPANILITDEGEPKLLDFGIAKILGPDSGPALTVDRAPLTPSYASPEQIGGERVTTASDVYSLGVVLYELLTGVRPFARPAETSVGITLVDDRLPARPSSAVGTTTRPSADSIAADRRTEPAGLRKALRGDLDTILLKALHPEVGRRYGSVRELTDDIERHRVGLPVQARPDTWSYRTTKFVRRHRVVLGLATAALAVLIGFLVTLLVQREQILRQRNRAEKATEFMVDLFGLADPSKSRGATITVREVLDRGAEEVRRELSSAPDVQAALMVSMARSYLNLGSHNKARPLAEEALALERRIGSQRGEASALDLLGEIAKEEGDYQRSLALLSNALEIRNRQLGEDASETLETLTRKAYVELLAGDLNAAIADGRRAVALAEGARNDERATVALRRLGQAVAAKGDSEEAESLLRRALEVERRIHGSRHPELLSISNDLAVLLETAGKLEEAKALLDAALTEAAVLFRDEPHPYQAIALGNQARVVALLGDPVAAEAIGNESLALLTKAYGPAHTRVAASLASLGELALVAGDLTKAEGRFREALGLLARLGEADSTAAAVAESNLAQVLKRQGRLDEAERTYRDALAHQRASLGAHHPEIALTLTYLGELLLLKGDLDVAAGVVGEALGMARATLPSDSPRLADPLRVAATLARAQGEVERAADLFGESLVLNERAFGLDHPDVARARVNLADLELKRQQPARAEELLRLALPVLEGAAASPDDGWTLAAKRLLGLALVDLGRFAAAEEQLAEVYHRSVEADGKNSPRAYQGADNLARLYRAWNRPADAETWRARASPKPE
ncbi:MAG: tetratricopeptide repeat protein [Thermoanaerobaculia bacterium]|nr:tetratricopeptide repeat protein [Thermoanaerobaculia bacterium]